MSKKFIDENSLSINVAEDYIEFKGTQYRIATADFRGNFLDAYAEVTYSLRTV